MSDVEVNHGDCLDVMRGMADRSVDIVVTSPPFNQLGSRVCRDGLGMHQGNGWIHKAETIGYADDMPEPEYQRWLAEVVAECLRISKGLVWVNHKIRYRDGVAIHPARFLPFPIWSEVVWSRGVSMALNCRRFSPSHEYLLAFGEPHWWDDRSNRLMSVWTVSPVRDRADHPCPFPIAIAARPIAASCPPGGVVLDPFAGSGTVGVACLKAGRRAILIESDHGYVSTIRRRLRDAATPLFDAIEEGVAS